VGGSTTGGPHPEALAEHCAGGRPAQGPAKPAAARRPAGPSLTRATARAPIPSRPKGECGQGCLEIRAPHQPPPSWPDVFGPPMRGVLRDCPARCRRFRSECSCSWVARTRRAMTGGGVERSPSRLLSAVFPAKAGIHEPAPALSPHGPRPSPGRRRWGIDRNQSPSPEPRPYSSRPRRGGGRVVPARCGGGEWSSGIRRRGRKPPFRTCAGVPSARSWAAVRADRRGRAGRVRDKRVNSPAHPWPAGERPRGALRRRRNGPPLPLRRASPGRSAILPNLPGSSRKRRRSRAFSPPPPSPPPRTAPRLPGSAQRTGPARWLPAP
jgi:hypothetical protein